MFLFRIVFGSVAIGIFLYLSQQLTRFSDFSWILQLLITLLIAIVVFAAAAMPLFFWSEDGRKFIMKRPLLLNISYYSLPLMSSLLFFVGARDVVAFICTYFAPNLVAPLYYGSVTFIMLLAAVLLLFLGIWKVQRGPELTETTVDDSRVPTAFAGTRILQISDLHISHFLPASFLFKVLNRIQEVKPDMIVLTGDIIDGDLDELMPMVRQLSVLHAPLGVFYVPGNHEYYWAGGRILETLRGMGIKVLVNEALSVQQGDGEILVAGIPDPTGARFGYEKISWDKLIDQFKGNQFRILLSHQPGMAVAAASHGFHLQFSGHTHGGQFFPWNFFSPFIHKFNSGYYFWKGLHVYVNEGTAYWGPAVRNFTRCEVSVVRLISKR